MSARRRRALSCRGYTLLEMTIALVVFATVLMAIGLTSRKTTDAMEEKTSAEIMSRRAHSTIDRIIDPLVELELGALPTLEDGGDTLVYHVPLGWDAGIQWDDYERLALEYDPGELDDGIDNDGDELVDECQLVLTKDYLGAEEKRLVICRNVSEFLEGETPNGLDDNDNDLDDERGFSVDVQGDVLTLRLTLERMGEQGLVQTTATSSVRVRN